MPNERTPIKPLPVKVRPSGGTPYRVKDGDTWINVAMKNGLGVKNLIRFNFHTNIPEEVNAELQGNRPQPKARPGCATGVEHRGNPC